MTKLKTHIAMSGQWQRMQYAPYMKWVNVTNGRIVRNGLYHLDYWSIWDHSANQSTRCPMRLTHWMPFRNPTEWYAATSGVTDLKRKRMTNQKSHD